MFRRSVAILRLERIFVWDSCIKKCGRLLTKHIPVRYALAVALKLKTWLG